MRDPYLREAALGWWDGQRRSGKWVREDEAVGRLADKMGYGYDHHQSEQGEREEGKLRTNARIAVSAVKASFEPAHAA